ncbi:DUF4244 domain-containing protein [Aeromicrobium sp.]
MEKSRERGAATAEYTVGTLGAASIAYWLSHITIGDPDRSWFGRFIRDLISDALQMRGIFSGDWVWRWMA